MDESTILIYSQIITICLFVLSEILGASKCKYNGVLEFVFGGCLCLRPHQVHISAQPEEPVIVRVAP